VQKNYMAPDGGSVVAILPGSHQEPWVIYYDEKVSPHYVLGQLSMKGGITPVGRLTDNMPRYMAVGPDHHLWVTTAYPNTIERVDLPQ
jgi:hypothetical protein